MPAGSLTPHMSLPHMSRTRLIIAVGSVIALAAAMLFVTIGPAGAAGTLLSQGRPITASSLGTADTVAANMVDGDVDTEWTSHVKGPQWVMIDLERNADLDEVDLRWDTASAAGFRLEVSSDSVTWTTMVKKVDGAGGNERVPVLARGRYVRLMLDAPATPAGYALFEFQVFGNVVGTCAQENVALGKASTASTDENAYTAPAAAFDGDATTRWSSAFQDPQWIQVDLGTNMVICQLTVQWEAAYATAFRIEISPDATHWQPVYSTTTGAGGTLTVDTLVAGRFVRLTGTSRATPFGYSLFEFALRSSGLATQSPTASITLPPANPCPWVGSIAPVATRVAQLLASMTLDQKILLLHGNGGQPYVGDVAGQPVLCIPPMGLQDGPAGVGDGFTGVTQLPAPVNLAASFDTVLEQQYGAVQGAEFAGKGVNVALGPTVNIVRDPRWGRAFESLGEDPYLSAQLATANIRGIQSQGVMAQIKHLAAYNQETNRNTPLDNVIVDTRTLQEIYLPAFQESMVAAAPSSVMCSYSTVNGIYACENPYLLGTALGQAGFGGFVTSDWFATHSTVDSANAGMHMEMPGSEFYGDALAQAVTSGQVTGGTIDAMAGRILTQMFAFGLFDRQHTGSPTAKVTSSAHNAIALKGAEEGTVLLKNNNVLPWASAVHTIAVIGADANTSAQSAGGGSASVRSPGTITPLAGIIARAGGGVVVKYAPGETLGDITAAAALAGTTDAAVVFASDLGTEGLDSGTIDLPGLENQLIASVTHANPHTVVVLNTNSAVTMPWLDQAGAVFEAFYPGQTDGTAIAALLFGDVNPSGKLPVTFPRSLADIPDHTAAQWPGTGGQVQYSEGLMVGYRWYDSAGIAPLFPFGFGLSYTSFAFSNLHVGTPTAAGKVSVTVVVTNTGTRAGTEVTQLYLGSPPAFAEPPRQLKGFIRTALPPGASKTIGFTLNAHDIAHWDSPSSRWLASAGSYQVSVGDSSRSLPLTAALTLPTTIIAPVGGGNTPATFSNPHGMSSPLGQAASVPIMSSPGITFTATGLPPGFAISSAGLISGTGTTKGTFTVTVLGSNSPNGVTFIWTVT